MPPPLSQSEKRPLTQSDRLEGVLRHKPILGPQTVHFDIANNCNVRCTTCWHHSPHLNARSVPTAAWKRKHLTLEDFKAILDDIYQLGGLEHVILSGMGDPSMNDELIPMVHYAQFNGIAATIITNLLRVDLNQLFAPTNFSSAANLDLLVSICGITPSSWNAFHAMNAGYESLLAQLAILKERSFKPKHVQVINVHNFHELDDMVRFADKWPAKRINFKFASLANGTEACGLNFDQKQVLVNTLIPRAKAVASMYGIETDLDAFQSQIFMASDRTAPIEEVGCYMGTVYCRITVEKELLYCCNTEISIGKLSQETPFSSLWKSFRYQSLRDQFARSQFFESCQQCGKYKQNLKWHQKLKQLHRGTSSSDFNDLDGFEE